MRMHITPSLRAGMAASTLFTVGARALAQEYCSSENTGSDPAAPNIYNSNLACQEHCGGYAFAVVQWQSCWCANYAPSDQQSLSSCNEACPGYPSDRCGNQDQALFGYVPLGPTPSSAVAAASPQTSTTEVSTTSAPSSTIEVSSTSSTSVSQVSLSSSTSSTTSQPAQSTSSVVTSQSATSTITIFSTSTPVVVVPITSSSSKSSSTTTPVTSVIVVTRSGAVVTHTVTSTPGSSESDGSNAQPIIQRKGLSGGAIAGIIIGVLVGLAAIVFGALFLRRRQQQTPSTEDAAGVGGQTRPRRNVSVLSRTGLLSQAAATNNMTERTHEEPLWVNTATGSNSVRHSMLFGGGAQEGVSPSSPLGSTTGEGSGARRNSKPFVYDQRLNPSALFANPEANGSRVSMQDQQDYSRPLGIANPDLRASFESRLSHN